MHLSLSRFDLTVASVLLACGLAIGLLGWQSRAAAAQMRFLYLTVDEQGRSQLHLAALTDEQEVESSPLTPDNVAVWDFAPTPDGVGVIYSTLGEMGMSDLWEVKLISRQLAPFLPCPQAACSNGRPGPDGRLLAFTRRNLTTVTSAFFSPPRLWLLDIPTGESAALFSDSQRLSMEPRWSADGQWLSFVSPEPYGLGVYNLNDGRDTLFTNALGEPGEWANHTAHFLTTSAWRQGEFYVTHLMRGDAESSELLDLSGEESLVEDSSGRFAPDDESIAFRRKLLTGPQSTRGKQIWVMESSGANARALTHDPEADFGPPVWSPDGRYLLARRFALQGASITPGIWLIDIATGESRLLIEPGDQPRWLPPPAP